MKPRLNYPYTMTSHTIEFGEDLNSCFALGETGVILDINICCSIYHNLACIWKPTKKRDQPYIIKLFVIEIRESISYYHLN